MIETFSIHMLTDKKTLPSFRDFALKVDPTANDKDKPFRYLQWACQQYLKSFENNGGGILSEDLYKIREDLELFEDKKKRKRLTGAEADINRYTVKTLAEKATELRGMKFDGYEDMLLRAPKSVMDQTTILVRDETGFALVPHSREASMYWGSGTRWCTAAKQDNAYYSYSLKSPLIIMNPAGTKEWYQGHISCEIMDAMDKEAKPTFALLALLDKIDDRFLNKYFYLTEKDIEGWSEREKALFEIRNGASLQYEYQKYRNDREVVQTAVLKDSTSLTFASPELQADRQFILEIVQKCGDAFEFVSKEFQADREIALAAIQSNGRAFQHVEPTLRFDPKFILEATNKNSDTAWYIDPELKYSNKEVALACARLNECEIEKLLPQLQIDPDILLEIDKHQEDKKKWDNILEEITHRIHEQPSMWPIQPNQKYIINSTSPEEWSRTDPAKKREYFTTHLQSNWLTIAYAGDCGIELTPSQEKDVFMRGWAEDSTKLCESYHHFPSLRTAWKDGFLSLRKAYEILDQACKVTAHPESPVPAPSPQPH